MRTFGELEKRHAQFLDAGGRLKDAPKFANVIHRPLIKGEEDEKIIDRIPPEELHLMMGGVDTHVNVIILLRGLEYLEIWTRSVHVMRHGYQGGGFNGGNAKKILDHLESLRSYLPADLGPLVDSLEAFRKVVVGVLLVFSNATSVCRKLFAKHEYGCI